MPFATRGIQLREAEADSLFHTMAPEHSRNPGSCHQGPGHLPLITRLSQKRTHAPQGLDTQHLLDFLAHMLDACPGIHVVPFVENVLQRRTIVPVAVVAEDDRESDLSVLLLGG